MADRYPLIVDSTSENIKELPTGDAILFLDNEKIKVGTGSDLTVYHYSNPTPWYHYDQSP